MLNITSHRAVAFLNPAIERINWIPEQNLWATVLFHGIRGAIREDPKDLDWVLSDSIKPLSFRWALATLGLDGQLGKIRGLVLESEEVRRIFLKTRFTMRVVDINRKTKHVRKYRPRKKRDT